MRAFLGSKNPNKRQVLIEDLLGSAGYVSHYTVFWQDLLRVSTGDPKYFYFKEYTRYIERFLTENKSFDNIVKDLLIHDGSIEENPAIGYYYRDHATGAADTFNATTRAFLGTRLGCAQCHNHRFDKWTQKEFYEASSFMHGVEYIKEIGTPQMKSLKRHLQYMTEDKRFKGQITSYSKMVLNPSIARVKFDSKMNYYPEDYRYDNAKPGSKVVSRIVFNYGDKELEGNTAREQFANWLTSKNNKMFANVMANRLWKRIMGVANMDPVDDYKDSIILQNQDLFETLGEIFIKLDYDMKAFMSVIFNSEAYQYASSAKNNFKQDAYKVQGALVKRMSYNQLSDSLLVLKHGPLDKYQKIDPQYFEFEDKLYDLISEYKKEMYPVVNAYNKKYGGTPKDNERSTEMIDLMLAYHEKIRELERYYDINKSGYIKNLDDLRKISCRQTLSSKRKNLRDAKNGCLSKFR